MSKRKELTGHIEEAWERAKNMAPRDDGARWVPREAIVIRPGITPRDRMIDDEHVARLAEVKERLRPLLVQRGTLVLVGGHHRYYAWEGTDIVPVFEEDIPDADLWAWAVRDNVANGLPATPSERIRNAKKMWKLYPEWSNYKLAEWTGVHPSTFAKWRAEAEHQAAIARESSPETIVAGATNVEIQHSVATSESSARAISTGNEQVRAERKRGESGRGVVTTFDPGPEPSGVWGDDQAETTPERELRVTDDEGALRYAEALAAYFSRVAGGEHPRTPGAWLKRQPADRWDRWAEIVAQLESVFGLFLAVMERAEQGGS